MINIIDTNIYNLIFKWYSMPTTFIMIFISHLGSATVLILLCVVFAILFKNKKTAIFIMLNLAVVYLFNVLIKTIVARPRPQVLKLVHETSYSFPSGHAMVAAGFYGFLIYIAYKNIKDKKVRNSIIVFLSLLIFLIGISRIYLGAHYATDIMGGFVIGAIYLVGFIKFYEKSKITLKK